MLRGASRVRGIAAVLAVVVMTCSLIVAATNAPAYAVIEPTACRVSAPIGGLFGRSVTAGLPPFVNYQATNGHGVYAGMAYTQEAAGATFRIIRYAGGHITVLDTFVIADAVAVDYSVRVVGIDDAGDVIASAGQPAVEVGRAGRGDTGRPHPRQRPIS